MSRVMKVIVVAMGFVALIALLAALASVAGARGGASDGVGVPGSSPEAVRAAESAGGYEVIRTERRFGDVLVAGPHVPEHELDRICPEPRHTEPVWTLGAPPGLVLVQCRSARWRELVR